MLVLTAGICLGQTARPPHYLEIQLPGGISSESVFIRYVLPGDTLGGWVQQRAGVSSYIIDTMRAGRSAAGIKALLVRSGLRYEYPRCGALGFAQRTALFHLPAAGQYFDTRETRTHRPALRT